MLSEVLSKPSSIVSEIWSWWFDRLTEDVTIRIVTACLAVLLAIFCYSVLTKKSRINFPPLPPGPRGLPLLGILPFIEPDHLYFSKLSKLYGPIFKFKLGSKICIVISSNSLSKQILKDHDAIFANRDPPAAGIAVTYGALDIGWRSNTDGWQNLRKICVREMMSKSGIDACYMLRKQEVREMVKEICRKAGSPIYIGEQVFLAIQNVIFSMLWGKEFHQIGVEARQVVGEIVVMLGKPNISDIFPVLSSLDLQRIVAKTKKLLKWFDKIFESVIANRHKVGQSKSNTGKDFLQVLLDHMQQGNDKSSLSMTELKALFMDIIVGGTDTSAATIEWAMAQLLQNPRVMERVHEELDRVVGKESIVEESHLPYLPYLHAVIKETFRLHPPFPVLVPHIPSKSCTIGGYTIPKGSTVFFNVWEMHRDPMAWNSPLEFQPERFLKEPGKGDYQGNNFNFLPFGSGRRICVGIPLAERMITYALATLLHSFDWKLHGTGVDFTEKFGFVMKKSKPLLCVATARLSTAEQYF